MAYQAPQSAAFGGALGKRYVNKQYGSVKLGQLGVRGANPRAGMSYSVGIDSKGRVVHIYRDGERIVMHTHAPNATPPHPNSFGGSSGQPASPAPAAVPVAPVPMSTHSTPTESDAISGMPVEMISGQPFEMISGQPVGPVRLAGRSSRQHQLALQAALAALARHGA